MNTLVNVTPATGSMMAFRPVPAVFMATPVILLRDQDFAVLVIREDASSRDVSQFLPVIRSLSAGNVGLAISEPTGDGVQLLERSPSRDALAEAISSASALSAASNGTLTPVDALIAAIRQIGEKPEATQ